MCTPYFSLRLALAIISVFLFRVEIVLATIPDVVTDEKCTPDSPLMLKEIYGKGKANYKSAAEKAVKNLTDDAALAAELKVQAGLSKHFSELSLKRICAIESQCSLEFAYSKASYKGFFQMGEDACTDVDIPFQDIDEKTEWKKSCEAGRLFLDKNWDRLARAGATLTDGEKATLTLVYLTHQLGAGGGPALFKSLDAGTSKTKEANDNMLANIPPKTKAAMQAGDHEITELEFYAYWVGSIDAVIAAFP